VPEGELASEAVRAASAPFSRAINVLFSPRRASNLVDESLEAGCEWSESRWAEEESRWAEEEEDSAKRCNG